MTNQSIIICNSKNIKCIQKGEEELEIEEEKCV